MSIIQRKKNKWRGVKWIDTRFARRYKAEVAMGYAMAGGLMAQGISRINAIRSSLNVSQIEKKKAMAENALNTRKAVRDVIEETVNAANKRWRA